MKANPKIFQNSVVLVDWANVYGWNSTLKEKITAELIFDLVKNKGKATEVFLFFGRDNNMKSRKFITDADKFGYQVITKPVKYIFGKRKCDFDIEITIKSYDLIYESDIKNFVFFSGDGDFAPLYEKLIRFRKKVTVIYANKHIGRELFAKNLTGKIKLIRINKFL